MLYLADWVRESQVPSLPMKPVLQSCHWPFLPFHSLHLSVGCLFCSSFHWKVLGLFLACFKCQPLTSQHRHQEEKQKRKMSQGIILWSDPKLVRNNCLLRRCKGKATLASNAPSDYFITRCTIGRNSSLWGEKDELKSIKCKFTARQPNLGGGGGGGKKQHNDALRDSPGSMAGCQQWSEQIMVTAVKSECYFTEVCAGININICTQTKAILQYEITLFTLRKQTYMPICGQTQWCLLNSSLANVASLFACEDRCQGKR